MTRRVSLWVTAALCVLVCGGFIGHAQFDEPAGFAVEDLQLISLESRVDWGPHWSGPVEAATVVAWLREHGFPALLRDLNGDGTVDELDTIALADIFGNGPMRADQPSGTTDALLVQALAVHVAREYPDAFELKIYDPGFAAEYQREFGVPFAPDVIPGILLTLEEPASYGAYVFELESAEAVIVGLELEEERNTYLTGRSYLFEPIDETTFAVDFAWGEEDRWVPGHQGRVLETEARQTDALYVRYEGGWELAEILLALSPIVEPGEGPPPPGPCPEDAIGYDVMITNTPAGKVEIEECVIRDGGLDIYIYTVTNISFNWNGCGVCWYGVPNIDGLPTVFQSGPAGWFVNPYFWAMGGWDWRAPMGDCGIEIGESEVFWFAVPAPTVDSHLFGGVGGCPMLMLKTTGPMPPPALYRVETTGPRAGETGPCPDVAIRINDWSCWYRDGVYLITVWATAVNVGAVDVGTFTCRAASAADSDDIEVTGGLLSGGSAPLEFHLLEPDPGYPPCVDVTAIADVYDDVFGECDEANNIDTQEVCCLGSPGGECPDPYVYDWSACFYSETPAPGGPSEYFVQVFVTIRNKGAVAATNVEVEVTSDGESGSATIPSISPGGTWTHTYTLAYGTDPIPFPLLVTVEVDPDDEIDETCYPAPDGEHNNYASGTLGRNDYCR